jgi:hypothetical protein
MPEIFDAATNRFKHHLCNRFSSQQHATLQFKKADPRRVKSELGKSSLQLGAGEFLKLDSAFFEDGSRFRSAPIARTWCPQHSSLLEKLRLSYCFE